MGGVLALQEATMRALGKAEREVVRLTEELDEAARKHAAYVEKTEGSSAHIAAMHEEIAAMEATIVGLQAANREARR